MSIKQLFWACLATGFFIFHFSLFISSCSEKDATTDEYANWQERNQQFLASVAYDSLRHDGWTRFKKYSLNEETEGSVSDYVYVKVIQSGKETEKPMFTDSVRVSYQGRLIPTASYPNGYVFDSTVYGAYSAETNSNSKFLLSATTMIDGFCTAILHMHRGDYWRVYIPSDLAYGAKVNGSIPAHSLLIFDMTLVDFSPAGETMPAWSARQQRQ